MMKRLTVDELSLEGQPGAFAGTLMNSSADLVTRVCAGDAEAFRLIFERYSRPLISFIFDTGASVHVVTDRKYFSTYKKSSKLVQWNQAKTLKIQSEGNCKITFATTRKSIYLNNCFHIPDLKVNIISSSALPNGIQWIRDNKNLLVF